MLKIIHLLVINDFMKLTSMNDHIQEFLFLYIDYNSFYFASTLCNWEQTLSEIRLQRTLFEIKYSVWAKYLESSSLDAIMSTHSCCCCFVLSVNGCTRSMKLFSLKCVKSCNMLLLQVGEWGWWCLRNFAVLFCLLSA